MHYPIQRARAKDRMQALEPARRSLRDFRRIDHGSAFSRFWRETKCCGLTHGRHYGLRHSMQSLSPKLENKSQIQSNKLRWPGSGVDSANPLGNTFYHKMFPVWARAKTRRLPMPSTIEGASNRSIIAVYQHRRPVQAHILSLRRKCRDVQQSTRGTGCFSRVKR